MHYIIDFKNSVSSTEIEDYLNVNSCYIIKEFNNFTKVFLVESTVEPPINSLIEYIVLDDNNPLELLGITTIISDQYYANKNPNQPLITIENTDQNWWKSYTIRQADLESSSYEINLRGQCSTVYVLDSGIEISHAEFVNRRVTHLWSFNQDPTDKNGHGTAIASVIVGNTCGVTDSEVKSVKIFDPQQPTRQSDLLTALDVIFSDIVNNQIDFPVVNCSWTITKNSVIDKTIKSMIDQGIYFVVSAGNNGVPIESVTPACILEAITVGAYNQDLKPCSFSNYTNSMITVTTGDSNYGEVDIWAPGEKIWAAGLNNSYGLVYGTSIAAAIQSAALAYNFSLADPSWKMGRSSLDFCLEMLYRRQNLLYLSDEKYLSSKNFVTTIANQINYSSNLSFYWSVIAVENTRVWRKLFTPSITEKVELFDDLPSCYTLNSSGYFVGIAPSIDQDYVATKIPIKMTMVDGNVIETDLEIIIRKENFTGPTGDDILDIKLQRIWSCQGSAPRCIVPFENDICLNDCGSGKDCSTVSNTKYCDISEEFCTGCYDTPFW